jgi:hypothetical protein|tara:strand:- start:119 stop:331 length:213 start_codon:yes stop_codon:yes gene_type:complete
MINYHVPINSVELDEDGNPTGSQTIDIVQLQGTKKRKKKEWRQYLRVRLKTQDIHKMNAMTKALGFDELL